MAPRWVGRHRAVATPIAVATLAVGLSACGSLSATRPTVSNSGSQNAAVVYTATGTGPINTANLIQYTTGPGDADTTTAQNVKLPWSKTVTLTKRQILMAILIVETPTAPSGSAACDITVNGKRSQPSSHQDSPQGGHPVCTAAVGM